MLEAMMLAKVGDDVFGDDPTVNELQEKAADMFGHEAALLCPSGTMTNQIAIKVHTQPGDEVICDETSHVYNFEGGGIAFNSGSSVRLIQGDRGRITVGQVKEKINPQDQHYAVSKLVVLENTSNKGGGSCYAINEIKKISNYCRENKLSLHLDGARVFNALAVTKDKPQEIGPLFDSISICLSKGLGAPVGSILLGSKSFIAKAVRVRKVFGGAMRQSGYLAAAMLYALDHHVERLSEDHERAKVLEKELRNCSFVEEVLPVETNIIIFKMNRKYSDQAFLEKLKENNILAVGFGPQTIRFVTHLDYNDKMLEETVKVLRSM
jgi:threonine aldolase